MNREYSKRSPAVKRLMKEAQELHEPTEQYYAQPLEDNLFEWHFTVRGPPDSDFDGGFYHGRIVLPPEYPMRPPSIMLLTPTGRFEVGTKICLSISGHHPETWQPSWSIRTVLLAIIGFMPTKGEGAIGALDYTTEERKVLARKSQEWKCSICQVPNKTVLPKVTSSEKSEATQREAREIAAQISFKKEDKSASKESPEDNTDGPAAGPAQPGPAQPGPAQPGPANAGAMAQNPFAMFQNPQFPFQPGLFQFPPNYMNQGQMPFNTPNVNQMDQSQASTPPSSTNQQSSSTPNEQSNVPNNGANSSQPGTELRQRSTPNAITSETTSRGSNESRTPENNQPVTGDMWAIVLILLISLVISSLIARRMYVTYEYKFDDSSML
ncbi:ubiquitin-conjugating enzyme E2 J1-like isoform X1 [Apostichopus japonicus]|uniref:ubiquitin-conjugating enzyme E2 J1-like isoform X1 n=1 Tax=Stichopus japonicus TaxID=307972 RepID=UPI003AB3D955